MTEPTQSNGQRLLEQASFLEKYRITKETFAKAAIDWPVMERIFIKHRSAMKAIEQTGLSVGERLRSVPTVHSLKVRIKDPERLIGKIIRKRAAKTDFEFTEENYQDRITDLIGIRVLHLFKDDWRAIHDFVIATWDLHETPIAYVRDGDPKELQDHFRSAGCDVREHPCGYRSIHYIIKSNPTKQLSLAELQVRTIFEEGWSEIDHRIRYPYVDDPLLTQFLVIFNRLAGSADEMGTFIKDLACIIQTRQLEYENAKAALERREADLRETISKLVITEQEKTNLQRQSDELRQSHGKIQNIPLSYSESILDVLREARMRTEQCSKCGQAYTATRFLVSLPKVSPFHNDLCPECAQAQ